MRQKLIDLLKQIEQSIPPPRDCHHCLTFARYGSDADGWEEKLCLQVNVGGIFHQFFLDQVDFEKTEIELISELKELLRNPKPSDQHGSGPGGWRDPSPIRPSSNRTPTAELQEFVYKVLAFGRGVTDWEQKFMKDMEGKQSYSEKQASIIERIYSERTA